MQSILRRNPHILRSLVFTISFGVLLLSLNATQAGQINGVLRQSITNPRYFTDDSGKAIYLTGSHTWNNFLDGGSSTTHLAAVWHNCGTFDYTAYLSWMQQHNHNFIRLWTMENFKDVNSGGNAVSPTLYLPGGSGGPDGLPRFDLSALNPDYFARLRQHVIQAGDKGIYVSIMLFNVWGVGGYGNTDSWQGHPYHNGNNINGIDGDPNQTGKGLKCQTLDIPGITALQDAYVLGVINSIKDLDNVLFEIDNEGIGSANDGPVSKDWQYHMINLIKNTEAGNAKQHPVGMTAFYYGPTADLLASGADWISPATNYDGVPYDSNPPATTGNKVFILDTDHLGPVNPNATRVWVWKSFIRGYNPIYMDQLGQFGGATNVNQPPWIDDVRNAMGDTKTYADKMDLVHMIPHGELYNPPAGNGYVLANPGSEYLVYQPGGGSFNLTLPAGTYTKEWFNPVTRLAPSLDGTVGGGGAPSFTPPTNHFSPGEDAVLYLRSNGAGPTPTPAPTATPTPGYSFYRGINLGMDAAAKNIQDINGQVRTWKSYNEALTDPVLPFSLTVGAPYKLSPFRTFTPAVDTETNDMLNDGIWRAHDLIPPDMSFSQTLPNGHYGVYFWTVENFTGNPNYRSSNVRMEGTVVASGIGTQPVDHWTKYGPYDITVCDGSLDVTFVRVTGDPGLEGLEIYKRNLELVSAVSRKTHGTNPALTFDVPLPLTSPFGIECRDGGLNGNHQLVLTFSNTIVSGNVSVTSSGAGSISGSPTFEANVMKVNLTGVADIQQLTITLSNVTDNMGQILANTPVTVGILFCDVTGNASISSTDVSATRNESGHELTNANFRMDVNSNGAISSTDVSIVRAHSGNGLP
jgi:dockerin type I repeat protein